MMLVLITNSTEPYRHDVPQLLSLPNDLSHRFRYREKWINLSRDLACFEGDVGLVVLRNYNTAQLLPVRYVIIEKIYKVGDIRYIALRAGEYVDQSALTSIREAIEASLATLRISNCQQTDLDSLVLEADVPTFRKSESQTEVYDRWTHLIESISEFEDYMDYSFFMVLPLRDAEGHTIGISNDGSNRFAYSLKPQRLYILHVIQRVISNLSASESIERAYNVELRSDSEDIIIPTDSQKVVGKYDLLEFTFRTPKEIGVRHGRLTLSIGQNEKKEGEFRILNLPLPIEIKATVPLIVWYWISFAVFAGTSVAIAVPDLVATYLGVEKDTLLFAAVLNVFLFENRDRLSRAVSWVQRQV